MKKSTKETSGITLIALVITIIILLILAGVSIATLTDSGLFEKAQSAKEESAKSQAEENVKLAMMALQIEEAQKTMTQDEKVQFLKEELKKLDTDVAVSSSGTGFLVSCGGYEFEVDSDYNITIKGLSDVDDWDKTAAPDNVFIWQSNDPNDEGYGIVIGYTANVENYTVLRFPTRCKQITFSNELNYEGIDTETSRAFTNNVKKVEIPDTVTIIGERAFGGSNNETFEKLEEVIIGKNVTSIESFAFRGCEALASITIPDGVTSIGSYAFYGTAWYDNQPDGEIYVGKTFYKYKGTMVNPTSVEIKEGTTQIVANAFDECRNLISITIPDTVTQIGYWAFDNCRGLTSVTIPDSVTSIENQTFQYCTSLTGITIPDSVTNIGINAFSSCTNLSNITIPNSVISIGENAFGEKYHEISDTAVYNVVEGSYADTWVQKNKYGNQTINYITE